VSRVRLPVCKQQGLELGSEGLADLGLAVRDRDANRRV